MFGLVAERPSSDDVLEMMADIPPMGAYVRTGHAQEIADAIADKAEPLEGLSLRETEALLAVYAAKESANQLCPVGDGGKSLGVLQLQGVPASLACRPSTAVPLWLARARSSMALCASNAPDERLAALASGRCDRGRQKVAERMRLAKALAQGRDVASSPAVD